MHACTHACIQPGSTIVADTRSRTLVKLLMSLEDEEEEEEEEEKEEEEEEMKWL